MSAFNDGHHAGVTYSSIGRANVVKARVELCASCDKKALNKSLALGLAFALICVQCIPGFNDDCIAIPKSFSTAYCSKVRVPTVYSIAIIVDLRINAFVKQ